MENFRTKNLELYINYIKQNLRQEIDNVDLYCILAKVYENDNNYDKAYLWYQGALSYCKYDDNKIKMKLDEIKKNNTINVRNLSIIIVTHDNLENLKNCIKSIFVYDKYKEFEIIIVDNNSKYDTSLFINGNDDFKVVTNDNTENINYCFNRGLKAANKDNDILFIDDNVQIMPNVFLNMRLALYSDNKIGAVGAISNNFRDFNNILKSFSSVEEYHSYVSSNNISNENSYVERVFLEDFAVLIKREVINSTGIFDEEFICSNNGMYDYSLRIREQNYKLVVCNDSIINHCDNKSKYDIYENQKRDKARFKDKWGINPFYSSMIRYEIINLFNYCLDEDIKVLEVGCGCGSSLMQIKNKYKNSLVYGIDIDKDAINIASKSIEAYCGDIENDDIPFNEEYFDIIMLPDVLEHLRDPWEALKKISKYLKKDGQIIASIPNVMHISVIDNLLSGYWSYEDAGILDRTHLRFFTFNEILKLFKYCGHDEVEILSKNIFVSTEQEQRINLLGNLYKSQPWQFKTYQYLVSTKKLKTEIIKTKVIKKCDDDKMFSFIICQNDLDLLSICESFISKLKIPEGYGVEILNISKAQSMTKGYNAAIKSSGAKYKIYIHQDVFITNENLLFDLLRIFQDQSIGMVGLIGCEDKPYNGVWWDAQTLIGNVTGKFKSSNYFLNNRKEEKGDIIEAFIVDGCFIASQYDLEWNETFDGWDFYDASQSLNYRNNKLKVVVPNVEESWIFHQSIDINVSQYNKYRDIFIKEYYK